MNFWRTIKRSLPALCLISIVACKDNSKAPDSAEILQRSPYKTITDSIEKFPDNPGMYLERAIRLSQNKKLELATDDFKKSWDLSGDEGIALEYVSNLLLVNKLDVAMKVLKEGAAKFPENTEFNRRLGEIYSETGNNEGALSQFDDIIKKEPDNFEAWYDKGRLLAKMKDTAAAIAALEKSFALQPVNYTGIELANLFIGKLDPKALQICNYLIKNDTAEAQTDAVFTKGVYYAETGNNQLALAQFEECIQRDWKLTDAYIEKGIIYFKEKKIDSALKVFNLSITVSNTSADSYFWIGRCYEATADKSRAIDNYQRALSLDKTFVEAYERIKRLKNS